MKTYSLGIDIGSSSVKVSLLDLQSGTCAGSSSNPVSEAPIKALNKGWAEQDPESWWNYLCEGLRDLSLSHDLSEVSSIGITYQMHGLVAVDREMKPVRDAIIWCDSRAVQIGEDAFRGIGPDRCRSALLNSPGNFTVSKLAWVKRNEPAVYERIYKFMLPGDYIAWKLSGELHTTRSGLSEQIMWNFRDNCRADFVADYFGIEQDKFPDVVPSIGTGCFTDAATEELFGIPAGTPVSYRAGDQPNNAFSLNVLDPGEIATTGGTSGVVYGVTDIPQADSLFRVNTFLHVNDSPEEHRYGVLLCINGTGIMNSWIHRNVTRAMSYPEMNALASCAPPGSDGLLVLPFGNGAERMLGNRCPGAGVSGMDLVRHTTSHLLRATQEGIAFAFRYGIDIMRGMGMDIKVIRAGKANMFLSPLFRTTLATLTDADIELFDTDGSLGAARGGALGAGLYSSADEAFSTLTRVDVISPEREWSGALEDNYGKWRSELENHLQD